jgi:hypothetical protein
MQTNIRKKCKERRYWVLVSAHTVIRLHLITVLSCRGAWLETGFWNTGITDHLRVLLRTNNYNTIATSTIYSSLLHTLVPSVYYSLHHPFPGNGFQHRNYSSLTDAHVKSSLHSPTDNWTHSAIFSSFLAKLNSRLTAHSELDWHLSNKLFFTNILHGPNRKHRSQQFLYCYLRIRCRGNLFVEPLPSSGGLLWLHYSGLQASCHSMISCVTRSCVVIWTSYKWKQE